ncbi:MAG: hypothetical protein ACJ789_21515 [Thermomicrobiales bacterium]
MRDGNNGPFTNNPSGSDPDAQGTSVNRLEQALGGRPLIVYLVLFAGAGALLVLLMIVWISATGGGEEERPICLDISAADAQAAILAGKVSRVDIVVDRQHPDVGPTAVQLELSDQSCRRLAPTGADNRDAAYQVVGVVYVYNSTGEQRIRIHTKREDVPNQFLVTSTAVPTETPTLAPTVVPTETPTSLPTATTPPQPTSTATPTVEPTITLPPTQTFAPSELTQTP